MRFPVGGTNGDVAVEYGHLTSLKQMNMQDQTTIHGICRPMSSMWASEMGATHLEVIKAFRS